MTATEEQRARYEKLRVKIHEAQIKLYGLLDEDGHDMDCALRCPVQDNSAYHDHHCKVCGDDE